MRAKDKPTAAEKGVDVFIASEKPPGGGVGLLLGGLNMVSRITILKYHSWYLCQISLQIMLLPILTESISRRSLQAQLSFSRELPCSFYMTNIRIEYGGLTYYLEYYNAPLYRVSIFPLS